jgi:hypothetical protein
MTTRTRIAWLSGPALRLHAALLLGLAGAGFATWFEWSRAHAGHEVAWVYTFEWPLLAAFGVYLWWRLLHGDRRPTGGGHGTPPSPGAETDPELAAWQAYLERLHAAEPPGRAPHERP